MLAGALIIGYLLCAASPADTSVGKITCGDTVIVTAERGRTVLKKTPTHIEVVGRKDLALHESRRPSDIIGAVSGVDVEGGTGMGVPEKKTVSLDGLPAYYTLVLVDGARVLSSHFHTGADMDLVPSENIQRIEILKGPGSAQYGSNGIAGVVNIITKNGSLHPSLDFESRAGTHDLFESSLSLQGSTGRNVRYHSYAGWEQSNGAGLIEPANRLNQLDYKNISLGDKVDYVSDNTKLTAALNFADINSTFAHNPAHSRLLLLPVTLQHAMGERISLESGASFTRWDYKGLEQDADKTIIVFPELNEVANPYLTLHWKGPGENDVSAGADYTYALFERMAVPQHDRHAEGLYVQDNFKLSDHLILFGALRMDLQQNTIDTVRDAVADKLDTLESTPPVFSPSVAALYRPADRFMLKMSLGRGFRLPSLQEMFQSRFGHEDAIVNGNPGLKPEKSSTLNGSVEYSPLRSITFSIGGAATMLDNMISYYSLGRDTTVFDPVVGDTPTVHIFGRKNLNRAFIGEGDVSVHWNIRPLSIDAKYSYTYNNDLDSNRILNFYPGGSLFAEATGTIDCGNAVRIEPFLSIKRVFSRKVWSFGMEAGEIPGQESLDNYQDLSAGVTVWFLNRYSLFIKGSNLLGQQMENYEDVLMKTNGDRLFEGGFRVSAY